MARSFIFSPAHLTGSLATQILAAMGRQEMSMAAGENHPVVSHYKAQARADEITALRNQMLDHIDLDLDHLDMALAQVSQVIAKVTNAREMVLEDNYEGAKLALLSVPPGVMASVADIANVVSGAVEPANLPDAPGPLKRAMPKTREQDLQQAFTTAFKQLTPEQIKELSFFGRSLAARTPCTCPDCADLDGNEDDLAGGVPVFLYLG